MYDDLVVFTKIVKTGNFAEASKVLNMNPSTLTRKIQNLEDELNIVLLKRDTRDLELSSAGQRLYDKFCTLELDLKLVVERIENEKNDMSGTLRISLPSFFAAKIISPYLSDFLREYPDLKIDIIYQSKDINLIKDPFDLAIMDRKPQKQSQKMKMLCRSKYIFYCYKSYIEKHGLPTSPEKIEELVFSGGLLDNEFESHSLFLINRKDGQKRAFNIRQRVFQDSAYHEQKMAEQGEIINIGVDILLKDKIESGEVVVILPDYYIAGEDYYLLTNPEGKNKRSAAFIEFLNKCMSRLTLNENLEMADFNPIPTT